MGIDNCVSVQAERGGGQTAAFENLALDVFADGARHVAAGGQGEGALAGVSSQSQGTASGSKGQDAQESSLHVWELQCLLRGVGEQVSELQWSKRLLFWFSAPKIWKVYSSYTENDGAVQSTKPADPVGAVGYCPSVPQCCPKRRMQAEPSKRSCVFTGKYEKVISML